MKSTALRFSLVTLVSLGLASEAAAALSVAGASSVHFQAVGPAGLKIDGSGAGVKATEADGKVTFTASTAELKTGIGLRDRHLREHIDAEKFPEAKLVVDRSKVSLPASGSAEGAIVTPLTFHGVTKPTKVSYKITKTGAGYHVEGSFDLNIIDHGVKKPCYLGVCVEDVVKVSAEFDVGGA
ncbi:MAG TPA: YceI family protein [Polyangiaceae bacterium]|nr:YceI family protein [Polyangiaceae bacterium]